ncbi:MAG TPA: hypothetical protein VG406_15820 [Isosphaeraceae bacterium]|nr:hypothetical protein [Isosphaeraceae bacterium]
MNAEDVLVVVAGLVTGGLFIGFIAWVILKSVRQMKAAGQLTTDSFELHRRSVAILDRQDELLDRQDELLDRQDQQLDRQDELLGRVEALIDRLERRLDS